MSNNYLYLALNIGSFSVPFIFSFYPKANFSKEWRYVLPGILITAIIFLAWDIVFTKLGVWGFNESYITGLSLFNLPMEEVLFFFCVPYACIFTYFAFHHLFKKDYFYRYHELISSALIIFLLTVGVYFIDRLYTSFTFLTLGFFITYLMLKRRSRFLGRFYFTYLILLLPFFLINGVLTGSWIDEPVVWYNIEEHMGFRLGTIPIEDVFYGMLMILMSITISEELKGRFEKH